MKVIIADTGAIISLGILNKLDLIEKVLGDFYIPEAVWIELNNYKNPLFNPAILENISRKVIKIKSKNYLAIGMDYGESESVILYQEMKADFLLIDDHRARMIAETLNINCIGSIGILLKAKQMHLIDELKPVFELLVKNNRYFSFKLLNQILLYSGESEFTLES